MEVTGVEPASERACDERLQVYPGTLFLAQGWVVRPAALSAVQENVTPASWTPPESSTGCWGYADYSAEVNRNPWLQLSGQGKSVAVKRNSVLGFCFFAQIKEMNALPAVRNTTSFRRNRGTPQSSQNTPAPYACQRQAFSSLPMALSRGESIRALSKACNASIRWPDRKYTSAWRIRKLPLAVWWNG